MRFRWIEKYEISFEEFALERCYRMSFDEDNYWICDLPENNSYDEENCNACDCPLCYPQEKKMDGDIDTAIVYRDVINE